MCAQSSHEAAMQLKEPGVSHSPLLKLPGVVLSTKIACGALEDLRADGVPC